MLLYADCLAQFSIKQKKMHYFLDIIVHNAYNIQLSCKYPRANYTPFQNERNF